MKPFFTRRGLAATAIAAAVAAVSIGAIAQNAPPAPTAPQAQGHRHDPQHHAEHLQRMQQRMAQHQERLKASLQLTPEQEPAWNAFIARMQPAERPVGARMDRDEWSKLTTPERLARMEAMKAERDKAMGQRHDAIRSFYAQLNPAQQKAFDAQQGMGMMRAGMKEHRGHSHGHRQGEHRM
jgi:periplasmic protein CpxP/Spy